VLPPRRRMPIEVVARRNLAENDAGRRQTPRQLAAARLLDPFDLDVPEMRLAARIGVEVVYPHRRLSRAVGSSAILAGEYRGAPALSITPLALLSRKPPPPPPT